MRRPRGPAARAAARFARVGPTPHLAGRAVAMVALVVLLAACGSAPSSGSGPPGASPGPLSGTVTVDAAASLKEAFTTLASQFEAAHPGTKVVLNFGPSSGLAAQITAGSPADVFASASTTVMDRVVAAGDASSPTTFARNVMEVVVPSTNPAGVTGLADLARSGVKVALCQPAVPCGSVAAKVFANAGITVTPVSEELDVKSVLTKVILGEVDAGVVYVTDVRAAGAKVSGIEIPPTANASTSYPIATLTAAANPRAAAAFTRLVLSPAGQRVLAEAGFTR